jgi:hypothetical protein
MLKRHHIMATERMLVAALRGVCSPQLLLVGVADFLEDGSSVLCRRLGPIHHSEETKLVLDNIGDSLRVCRRA